MSLKQLQQMGRKDATTCTDRVTKDKVEDLAQEAWWNVAFFEAENEGIDGETHGGRSAEEIYCDAFAEAYLTRLAKPKASKKAKKTKVAPKKKPKPKAKKRRV
jgi:hypothetical protein